ncbi:phosphoribosylglycinamide formyltransferase [Amaricoccus macauensis]|uniref:phosphoribosylglycinamide formyltransferase n=1 Tax=Amaricoccus macauensis TaxID=57001 RepID=UPI003C7CB7E6
MRKRVAILISGGGSNMLALARDMADRNHPGLPCVVVSNRPDAGGLEKAREMGIDALALDHRIFKGDRAAFEAELTRTLEEYGTEIVCLAGFMRILTPAFIDRWAGQMINIHPSILPLFPGLETHRRAIEAGMSVHGCTVHEVTADLDSGPILGQAVIPIERGDTPGTLASRLLKMEHRLYPAVLRRFAAGDRTKVTIMGDVQEPGPGPG